MRRIGLCLLTVALAVALSASPAFALATHTHAADFESGVLPPGFATYVEPGSESTIVNDAAYAHGGTRSLRQHLLPTGTGLRSCMLSFVPDESAVKVELDGWLYCANLSSWGMGSSPFYLMLDDGKLIGLHTSYNVGGNLGYLAFEGVAPQLWGYDVPQRAWHHVVVTYDRVAGTEDVSLDGVLLVDGAPCTSQAVKSVFVFASGGWVTGVDLDQYVDDIVVREWLPTQQVRIDVRPGTAVNVVNLGSRTRVPVAIFGAADFDVRRIDLATVRLAGAPPVGRPVLCDIDKDGRRDLLLHFNVSDMQLLPTDQAVILTGSLQDGTAFSGSDTVKVVVPWKSRRMR